MAMAGKKAGKGGGFASMKKQQQNGKGSGKKGKLNPFDVKQNAKTKFQVLGKRIKGQTRNVAVARAQAETKRRKTLAVQYKTRNKVNAFKDKRIGEQDPTMSLEDKMMARFQTERKRKLRNAQMYVLGDGDEEEDEPEEELFLTHDGKQIDDYDQLNKDGGAFDDEGDDDFSKRMDKEVVDKLHFGGGSAGAGANGDDAKKTHKEIMQEVMMKSKMHKAERQKNKVAQEDATDNLDAAFSEIQGLLSFRPSKHQPAAPGEEDKKKPEMDEFDKMTREFAFEAKAKATERRMTPEETAKREKDRLDALEKKRLARMNGEDEDEEEDEEARKKKKQKQQMIIMPPRLPTDDDLEEAYEVDEQFRDGEEEQEEEDGDEEGEGAEEEVEEESGSEEEEVEEGEDEEEEVDPDEDGPCKKQQSKTKKKSEEELPYVFDCPESLVELLQLFDQYAHNAQDRGVIMERLVTYNSPKLSVVNQKKMTQLLRLSFDLFLRYAAKYQTYQQDFDWLTCHLQRLSQELPDVAGVAAREFLIRVFKRMRSANGKAQHHGWPEFRALLLFKVLASVFPVSDLRHNVVSPLETLLGECMTNGQLTSVEDTRRALICAMLSLAITKDKKRFAPEVLNVLKRVLVLFVARSKSEQEQHSWLLSGLKKWQKQAKDSASELPLLQFVGHQDQEDDGVAAVSVLHSTMLVLRNASRQYAVAQLACFFELINPLYLVAHGISQQIFSNKQPQLNAILDELHQLLEQSVKQRHPLRLQTFAPATIKTLTPKFDENYSLRKDKTLEKEKAQMKQLERQVKRARKNAARELRRDAEFLAREKEHEEDQRLQQKQQKQREIRRWLEEQNATFNEQVKKGGHMLKGGGSGLAKTKRVRLAARGKK